MSASLSCPQNRVSSSDPQTALKSIFGFDDFRPGQAAVVEALLSGRHVLSVMPTGAGKSLCFQLPALMKNGVAIVVSPLIALMENQVALLKAHGVQAGMIHSGRDRQDNVADWKDVVHGECRILYMSPERLLTTRMISALKQLKISYFVIDEAHCVSQWGHHFRQEYLGLGQLHQLFPDVPIAAFTATADPDTRQDILNRLFSGQADQFVLGFDRPNLSLKVREKNSADRQIERLVSRRRGQCGIIYCRSRKGAETTAAYLQAAGFPADAYHAGLPDQERSRIGRDFLQGQDQIVCATVAFGMGIDKPDIRYVIHRDMPASLESYYQEIGRAGRDGEPAEAILLYGRSDPVVRRKMIDSGAESDDIKRRERGKIDLMTHFCESRHCRRNTLLTHFGEVVPQPCGRCDICLDEGRKATRRAA